MTNENDSLKIFKISQKLSGEKLTYAIKDGQHVITGFARVIHGRMVFASLSHLHTLLIDMADAEIDILLIGERGVGKELATRFIVEECRKKNLVPINCSAIEDAILSSQLFGHEKGAFTGATENHDGLIMAAHKDGSTLFLDEIGDASDRFQAKILRYLETGDFLPVGSNKVKKNKKVSVICATSKYDSVRSDLRDRFQLVAIPPLRERRNDIPLLIRFFWGDLEKDELKKLEGRHKSELPAQQEKIKTLKEKIKKSSMDVKMEINSNQIHDAAKILIKNKFDKTISKEALSKLKIHSWPGNVRELKRALALAPILCKHRGDNVLRLNDFPNIPSSQGKEDKSQAVKFSDIEIKREALPITTFLKIPNKQVLDDKVFEQIEPKEYRERFWKYCKEKGYTAKEIVAKFQGKIKLDNAYKQLRDIRKGTHIKL